MIRCIYAKQECGCTVIGNGTIPDPLAVKLCVAHSGMGLAHAALVKALEMCETELVTLKPRLSAAYRANIEGVVEEIRRVVREHGGKERP